MPKKKNLAKMRKHLRIKPITRKQALSYNMTATPNRQGARPNAMGVTAISAVNGPGAYDANYRRRYSSTLAALSGRSSTPNGEAMFYYRNAKKGAAKKAAPKAAPKAAKKAKPKAAPKYPRGKSPKQQANLLRGRKIAAYDLCSMPRPDLEMTLAEKKALQAKRAKSKSKAKKAKANKRSSAKRNGVASYISNVRRNVMSFSEWSKSMHANRRRPKKRAASKRSARSAHSRLARALANARRRRRARRNYAPGVGMVDVKAYSRGPLRAGAKRKVAAVAAPKKAAKKSAKKAPKKSVKKSVKKSAKKAVSKKAKANRRRRAHRNLAQAAANRRRSRHRKAHRNLAQAAANRRRSRRRVHANKRRRHARRNGIASYISNIGGEKAVEILKQGIVIGGGLLAHKLLTNLVFDNIDALKNMHYGKSLSGAAVAAVGIPVSAMLIPGDAGKELAVGMGAALFHTVLVDVLSTLGQSKAASMLGDYTERSAALPAAGYGAYYEFAPGQQYSGMGAYYEFAPGQQYSGMGEYIEQGASGFGEYVEQAAAGFGGLAQAAAGFGSPMLAQAAAGVGEYVVQGAQGIGEYEEVEAQYTAPHVTREGIAPNLGAAEHALSIAEAAAGVGGFGDVDANLQQIVYPKGEQLNIQDDPGGSRSGVFFGGNGVFGP